MYVHHPIPNWHLLSRLLISSLPFSYDRQILHDLQWLTVFSVVMMFDASKNWYHMPCKKAHDLYSNGYDALNLNRC